MLDPLNIPPGIIRDASQNAVRGRWYDAQNVRFHKDRAQVIGGCQYYLDDPLANIPRAIKAWNLLDGTQASAYGTRRKLYLFYEGTLSDITPIRDTASLTDPFDTTDTETTVTVTDTLHGALTGDTVHISGASAVGGITIDGEYVITKVDDNSYTIEHTSAATSTATGGGSVTAEYEVNIGEDDASGSTSYGAGSYGSGGYGGVSEVLQQADEPLIWSLDTWGEDLIATFKDETIYQWDASSGASTRAAAVSNAPSTCRRVHVSSTDRILIALGAHDGTNSDPMCVRWPEQGTLTSWTVTATNTAENRRLEKGTRLMGSADVDNGILVLSDTAAYLFRYIGAPYIYEIEEIADDCGLVGPSAIVTRNGVAYWMSNDRFFKYDGTVTELECDLLDYVTEDLNLVQMVKSVAGYSSRFDDIFFFYPGAGEDENDRYISAHFKNSRVAWSKGNLSRTAWFEESGITNYPLAADESGYIYYHESGTEFAGSAIDAYAEIADLQIGDGDQIMHIRRFVPDFKDVSGDITVTLTARKYPQSVETRVKTKSITSATEKADLRNRGRHIAFKVACNEIGAYFDMGQFYVDAFPDGGR